MFYIRRNGKISVTGNSNYLGKPTTMATQTKIPLFIVRPFQEHYFESFPEIPEMHRWHAEKLQRDRYTVNCFGLRRDFFDRPESDETLRSAVAHSFQSATFLRVALGLWRLWKYMGNRIQLLAQLHDANYFQYRLDDDENDVIREALKCMKVTHYHKLPDGRLREFTVPNEVQIGFNWAHRWRLRDDGTKEDWNPRGLDKWIN
jgi:DNA polymerase I-like protein with 3'-5' exonuclease and polymerase domains